MCLMFGLDITWLQDAGLGGVRDFDAAYDWAQTLVFGGFDDWRLPRVDPFFATTTPVECAFDTELNCRNNEFGHLYYYSLGGGVGSDLTGDQGLFFDIAMSAYWSETDCCGELKSFWTFSFLNGTQAVAGADPRFTSATWAVRDGDVAVVPLPAAAWLLGSALLGLIGMLRRASAKD